MASDPPPDRAAARAPGAARGLLSRLPGLAVREFRARSATTPFLVWVTFTISFITIRLFATLAGSIGNDYTDTTFYVGRNVVLGGYHIHHIGWGIVLVALAGWIALHWKGPNIARTAAILYGVGLGFIVDELGFVVGGVKPYRGDLLEVFTVGIALSGLFLSAVYFPSFWRGIRREVGEGLQSLRGGRRPSRVRSVEGNPPPFEAKDRR